MTYRPGDPLAICGRCGLRFRLSQLKKEWTGLMVCEKDYESRHPQELIKPTPRATTIKNARPEGVDTFLEYGDVTPEDL